MEFDGDVKHDESILLRLLETVIRPGLSRGIAIGEDASCSKKTDAENVMHGPIAHQAIKEYLPLLDLSDEQVELRIENH